MPQKPKKASARLPGHVRPVRYSITLEPDLDNFTFQGDEAIRIRLSKASKAITLHSAELDIRLAEISFGKKKLAGTVSYDDKEERATVTFAKNVPKGNAILKLSFAGILNDKMRGFYRSRYELNGKTHHMAVTQFESTDARRAFPCFDEPAQKAVFEVSLIVPKDRTAISNTLETVVEEHRAGYKLVKFAPSPTMSSYLLAFIVGHFEYIQKKTKSGVLVRVFTTPGKKKQATFALECAAKCIEFYERYFGIRYPLPVMDLIAIPDFAAGAMENWGAVTYRETAVLVDPEHSATANRQRVALVIAHELAHQWFGNLVTMEWWTHLWLNEGFATYMEYVAIDAIYPKWNIWAHFVSAEGSRGLALDGLANTHAIEVDVHHPQEISEIFDAVSYSKGASVIRMLATYLGEGSFRRGLRNYLRKHAYGNALTEDLWRALERASGKKVAAMMRTWTRKPGYPLVSLEADGKRLNYSQRRFFPNRDPGNRDSTTWMIPLSVSVSGKRPLKIALSKRKGSVALQAPHNAFIKGNLGETSFVRVAYQPENLRRLGEALETDLRVLPEADRFGIIRDAFALAQSGVSSTEVALSLASSYRKERSYIVWSLITQELLRLRNLLFGTPLYERFAAYGQALLKDAVRDIGWTKKPGESDDTAMLRSALVHAAGILGDEATVTKAEALFSGKTALPPDLRASIYHIVAQNGGEKEFKKLVTLYETSTLEEEKDRALRALCGFRDAKFLNRMLDFAFSEKARGQDILKAVNFVWANPFGRSIAWEYLKTHWDSIEKRFGGGHLFSRFLLPASYMTTTDEANDIANFFKRRKAPGIERTIAQAVEQIRSNAAWYARDEKKLAEFLLEG